VVAVDGACAQVAGIPALSGWLEVSTSAPAWSAGPFEPLPVARQSAWRQSREPARSPIVATRALEGRETGRWRASFCDLDHSRHEQSRYPGVVVT